MKRYLRFILLSFVTLASLIGCTQQPSQNSNLSTADQIEQNNLSLKSSSNDLETIDRPIFYYQESADKRSEIVEKSIKSILDREVDQLLYYYNYSDLNDDGKHETLVLVQKKDVQIVIQDVYILNDEGKNIGYIKNWEPPVVVGSEKVNGYRVLYKSMGRGVYESYEFDGSLYKINNSKTLQFESLNGIGYLSDIGEKRGFQLK